MSGRGRRGRGGSVSRGGRGQQQQYSNVSRGGGSGGRHSGGGRGRGRLESTYNAPQSSGATSSSSQPSSSASRLPESSDQNKTLSLPATSKAVRFPLRPGFGSVGLECVVRANHFLVEFDSHKDIHQYNVTITPEILSREFSRRIIRQLVLKYKQSHLGDRVIAYDGKKIAYTAAPLPFESEEFNVTLFDENARKERKFRISIKFDAKADLHYLLEFLKQNVPEAPQETIQALNVVLRDRPSLRYEIVGRSFFNPSSETKGTLGEGLQYLEGFYQSLRPTQMGLSLNIDTSARAFYEPVPVTDFIKNLLNIRNLARQPSPEDLVKVKRALKGAIVQTKHLRYVRRHKVSRFTDDLLNDLSFQLENKGTTTVVQYYKGQYGLELKYKFWPAFLFGTNERPSYVPLEICEIAANQRYPGKLSDRQKKALSKATCVRPNIRMENINKMLRNNNYDTDEIVGEFGIEVIARLTQVSARVLPRPMLKYSGNESCVDPVGGSWNMKNKKMVSGGKVDYWTCVTFASSGAEVANSFCKELVKMCRSKGMVFSQSFIPLQVGRANQIEDSLIDVQELSKQKFSSLGIKDKGLQLLIVILPDRTGSYGTIKRVCETELGLVSQCCKPDNVLRPNITYLENVALKINVKVGGINTVLEQAVLRKIPFLTDLPTIVFGADVTHPSPGEDSGPSIAAVVGSIDWPEVTKYRALVSAQKHRQEIIQDLYKTFEDPKKGVIHAGMIRELLLAFYHSTSEKPSRIIFYRDGVSEGQFNQVLVEEINAIRKACASIHEDYKPKVTFIVVQKRHHTRLFPADHSFRDKSGNIVPGTVVDTMICHPMEFDFYLCSHAGIKGTSRPTHYHVLYDENGFSADALQTMTYNLCYTYARCTRSVSIVPPAYYAHLAASRARCYIEGRVQVEGGGGGVENYQLPLISENVKDGMFFC